MTALDIAKNLTEKQAEVIMGLRGADDDGLAPMWFGGSNGSHHSNTARRLCDRGLVERRFGASDWGGKKRWRGRGSCRYRLTELGKQVAEEWVKL
jgi:hypothetical protein